VPGHTWAQGTRRALKQHNYPAASSELGCTVLQAGWCCVPTLITLSSYPRKHLQLLAKDLTVSQPPPGTIRRMPAYSD